MGFQHDNVSPEIAMQLISSLSLSLQRNDIHIYRQALGRGKYGMIWQPHQPMQMELGSNATKMFTSWNNHFNQMLVPCSGRESYFAAPCRLDEQYTRRERMVIVLKQLKYEL